MNDYVQAVEIVLLLTVLYRQRTQNERIDTIMATLKERFDAVDAALSEASTELTAELQALRDALANASVTLPADAEASLVSIEAKAKALADIVSNPVPPVEPPTE